MASEIIKKIKRGCGLLLREGPWAVLKKIANRATPCSHSPEVLPQDYLPSTDDLKTIADEISRMARRPVISVLLPVYNTPERYLRECIDSVLSQTYPHWELCIADDASSAPHIKKVLTEYQQRDSRVKVNFRAQNGHIAHASNSALELVTGEYVALLDHDDTLASHALASMALFFECNPETDIVYSDEDKISHDGEHSEPCFKAGWSPSYFRSFMYIGHLTVYRTEIMKRAGAFRPGTEGSQDYDLALRAVAAGARVKHIPGVLYHWRKHPESVAENIHAKPYAFDAACRSLGDAVAAQSPGATVEKTRWLGIYRVRGVLPTPNDVVSVVLPQRNSVDPAAVQALTSALKTVSSSVYEMPATGDDFCAVLRAVLAQSKASVVCIFSPYVIAPPKASLTALVELISLPSVYAVTGVLNSANGTVLGAGYHIEQGVVQRAFVGLPAGQGGYAARLFAVRDVTAAPFECIAIRRTALEAAFQYGVKTQVALEVLFALAVRRNGGLIQCTPHADFIAQPQFHPQSRFDRSSFEGDWETIEREFRVSSYHDRYYPDLLDRKTLDFSFPLARKS